MCAAPPAFLIMLVMLALCQVAAKNMPLGSLIIGVDLVPIKGVRGVKTLIGDITTPVRGARRGVVEQCMWGRGRSRAGCF